jgi:hypothetical protein
VLIVPWHRLSNHEVVRLKDEHLDVVHVHSDQRVSAIRAGVGSVQLLNVDERNTLVGR